MQGDSIYALGSSECFLGNANPLSSKSMFETCVLPTLLYEAVFLMSLAREFPRIDI